MSITFRLTKCQADQFIQAYCSDVAPDGAIERLTAPLKLNCSREERNGYTVQLDRGYYVNQAEIDQIIYGNN